jgi:hypothetical protein
MKLTWLLLAACSIAFGQRHELGFTLGRILSNDRGVVESKAGTALQVNYGRRVWANNVVALYGEVHFLASPLRDVKADLRATSATKDFASLYITPGLRLKFHPQGRIQPFVAVGGGYSLYEQSRLAANGSPNTAPRHSSGGALQYGGGVDVPLKPWLALRGDVRDFYTSNPLYNVAGLSGECQHNVAVSGGFVLRFGE